MTIFRKYINCQLFRTMISTTIFAAITEKKSTLLHYFCPNTCKCQKIVVTLHAESLMRITVTARDVKWAAELSSVKK